jgi:hypothetical protein
MVNTEFCKGRHAGVVTCFGRLEVQSRTWAGGDATQGAQPSRLLMAALFVGWSVSVYDGSMIDVKP